MNENGRPVRRGASRIVLGERYTMGNYANALSSSLEA